VLYEPPLEAPQADEYQPRLAKLQALLRANDIEGVYDAWWTVYLGLPPEAAEGIKASPIDAGMRPLARYLPRELNAHLTWTVNLEPLKNVMAPTLYLAGEETPAGADLLGFLPLLQGVLSNLRVALIPGQGHFANTLAPVLLADILREFLLAEDTDVRRAAG
jgi:pimeloyl-ACP methyl ester carboxylesterase